MNALRWQRCVVALVSVHAAGSCSERDVAAAGLKVRLTADLSGPSALVGAAYHAGRVDRLEEINRGGGVQGHTITYEAADTASDPSRGVEQYLTWKFAADWPEVVTIFGYDCATTHALLKRITAAEMPYLAQSSAGSLASSRALAGALTLEDGSAKTIDNPGAPFSYFVGVDASTGVRGALEFAAGLGGRSIAFCYCTSTAACTEPVEAGRPYARGRLGMEVREDLIIEPDADEEEIETKVADYFTQHADVEWLWLGNDEDTSVRVIRAAADLAVKFLTNSWAMSESLDQRTNGVARGRVFGVVSSTPYGALVNSPAMQDLVQVHDRVRVPGEFASVYYVMGYATVVVWEIALERLLAAGDEVSRRRIMQELDAMRNVNTGGLLPPISYTPDDHRPSMQVSIYSIDKDGQFHFETEKDLERKTEWLGW